MPRGQKGLNDFKFVILFIWHFIYLDFGTLFIWHFIYLDLFGTLFIWHYIYLALYLVVFRLTARQARQ